MKELKTSRLLKTLFFSAVFIRRLLDIQKECHEKERNRNLRGMAFNPLRANPKNSQTHPNNLSAIAKELFKTV